MIDTKIACQCGNRFKFGMDLVNGRAPDGLICPTCGAPATPACNALVDFLSGKEPAPPSAGTRPVKEVKITCACGARYKFDLELAEKEMPSPVTCPGCQADLTSLANGEIRSYIARHTAGLATPAAPVTPAAEPVPASPPSSASSTPAAAPPPTASASPPAASPQATPSPPASNATAATPVSDPFGPAPAGKSSGPNLKPLEAPKPNRPPPGGKPAAPPAKPGAPAAPASSARTATPPGAAKPDAAKAEAAKHAPATPPTQPAVKPAAAGGGPNFGLGIAGAVGGALVGAIIWFGVLKFTAPTDPKASATSAAWMALVVGVLAGLGARLLGRGASARLGGATCAAATLVILLMVWMAMGRQIDRLMAPRLKTQYDNAVATAQTAVKATDAELKLIIARSMPNADIDGARVTDDAVKAYRATEVPKHRDFLADKDGRAKFESRQRTLYRSMYPFEDLWQESFGIVGLLFLLAGIMAAAKIPMK